ncbi:MAG TPA: hypothetical protein P5232_03985 [Candidatus Moranbacteria bacterium]|nr:hypothetical protein [Candidatus Moranbacteria bacterium]
MNNVSDINSVFITIGQAISFFWWIILPIMFYYVFKILWIDFVGVQSPNSWHKSQEWAYLEIIPPREIERGPKMMENIFTAITGVLTTYNAFDEYIKGAFWHDRFSAEIIGEGGKMRFLIRTQKKYRNLVEAHVYAQYPDAEVLEVSDYTQTFPKVVPNKNWDLWGTDFEFVNEDPIPIKTYDRFEESVTGEMLDPMSAMAEVIGALPPDQHIWLQFVLQPLPEPLKKKYDSVIKKLKGEKATEIVGIFGHLADVFGNIFSGMSGPVEFSSAEKKELGPLEFRLSPGEKDLLKATEENLGKNLFRTKMRMIIIGRRENFDRSNISSFVGAIKQFNDINFNQVKPADITKTYGIIFFAGPRADFRKRKIYDRYIKRNMDGPKIVFSTKELATMFHFPDMGVKSPSITRTSGRLGSAPANLPIE